MKVNIFRIFYMAVTLFGWMYMEDIGPPSVIRSTPWIFLRWRRSFRLYMWKFSGSNRGPSHSTGLIRPIELHAYLQSSILIRGNTWYLFNISCSVYRDPNTHTLQYTGTGVGQVHAVWLNRDDLGKITPGYCSSILTGCSIAPCCHSNHYVPRSRMRAIT